MKLAYDWLRIVKKAWSLRFGVAAFIFGGAELLLPVFVDEFPRKWFAVLSLIALAGSMWTRLIRQEDYYQ